MRYRATCTIVYEIESDLEHPEAVKVAELELDEMLGDKDILRRQVKLERLRERRCNIQLGIFAPEDVLPFICREELKKDYTVGGKTYTVRMNSQRYFIFRESLCCAACGLKGTKMILEQNPTDKSPHFNLYGEEFGRLVLLTKDHSIAKSKGGPNTDDNMKTCCVICNNIKSHYHLTYEQVGQIRKAYNENCGKLSRKKLAELVRKIRQEILCPTLYNCGDDSNSISFTNIEIGNEMYAG